METVNRKPETVLNALKAEFPDFESIQLISQSDPFLNFSAICNGKEIEIQTIFNFTVNVWEWEIKYRVKRGKWKKVI